jgi:hypothetical protein
VGRDPNLELITEEPTVLWMEPVTSEERLDLLLLVSPSVRTKVFGMAGCVARRKLH